VTNANFREDVNVDDGFIDAVDTSLVKSRNQGGACEFVGYRRHARRGRRHERNNRTLAASLFLYLGPAALLFPFALPMSPIRTDQLRINGRRAALIFVAKIILTTSCSKVGARSGKKRIRRTRPKCKRQRRNRANTERVRRGRLLTLFAPPKVVPART